jgi:hypothetical protein
MPLFCYIHRIGGAVPYFEVFAELTGEAAVTRAAELLHERPDGLMAELWDDERLVHTIERQTSSAI